MKPFLLAAAALFFACAQAQTGPGARAPWTPKDPQLGTNLSGLADWTTEVPFVDVFRTSRAWISQREGASWGQGPPLDLDPRGWVRRLEPGCYAETLMCTIDGGHYPAGRYSVLFDGVGRLEAWGAGRVATRGPGRMTLDVDPSKGAIFLRLAETDPANYVRNIRVYLPGTEAAAEKNPFRQGFLDLWRGVTCLRFMDWQATNDSTQRTWADAPRMDDATWSERGAPVEVMVDLANRLGADPWFCMPHLADDGYVRQFATRVKKALDPSRKVYIEYSNEVWNGQFAQSRWAGAEGVRLGFATQTWEGAWHYTAYRSKQVFAIWEQVFGSRKRLVRVLASQAANPYVSERILGFQDAGRSADALAIAPYFGLTPGPNTTPNVATVAGWTVDQALDHLQHTSLPQSLTWTAQHAAVARANGLALVAYEGGQHMVGIQGGENDERVTALFHAANAHPRMGALYTTFLEGWRARGGGLFCNFSSTSEWSKWGSWGLLRYLDDDPGKSPKYQAVAGWARGLGQKVGR